MTLFYLRVFPLIDHKNQFFTLVNAIGPFVISLSIEILMICLFQSRITILPAECSTKHANAVSRFPRMS